MHAHTPTSGRWWWNLEDNTGLSEGWIRDVFVQKSSMYVRAILFITSLVMMYLQYTFMRYFTNRGKGMCLRASQTIATRRKSDYKIDLGRQQRFLWDGSCKQCCQVMRITQARHPASSHKKWWHHTLHSIFFKLKWTFNYKTLFVNPFSTFYASWRWRGESDLVTTVGLSGAHSPWNLKVFESVDVPTKILSLVTLYNPI